MDMKLLMRQAQEMQNKIQKIQEEVAQTEYEGSSGAGLVKVKILGSGNVKNIAIDDSLIDVSEKEVLEDLIVAAINDARKKADDGSSEAMKKATGGLNLPAGFKI